MTDIYSAPNSELTDNEAPAVESPMYKLVGIGLATAFGTVIAGGFLMSKNFKSMGEHGKARSTMIYAVVAFLAIFGLAFLIPESLNIPNSVFTITQVVVMVQLAKHHQGATLAAIKASNGSFQSNWKAFGISLLFLLGVAATVIVLVFAFGIIFESWM